MTHHVNIVLMQYPTEHQRDQITAKLEVYHQEHLLPMVFSGTVDWDLEWTDTNEFRLTYETGTSVKQDYDLDRQLLRYLELSVIPLVYYDDDVRVQIDSHDQAINDDGGCENCDNRWSSYHDANVLTTTAAYNDFTGA